MTTSGKFVAFRQALVNRLPAFSAVRLGVVLTGLLLSLPGSESSANPISFTPNGISNGGSVKCEVKVPTLGQLPVKNGSAAINGRVITFKAGSDFTEEPHTVLIGSVLRSEANLSSSPPSITGLALFLMGDWIEQIDDPSTADIIFRSTGQTQGRIVGMESDTITLKKLDGAQERIPLTSILYLRSPRVFVFKINLHSSQPLLKDTVFEADTAYTSFRPTAAVRTMSGSIIPQNVNNAASPGIGSLTGAKTATPSPASFFDEDTQAMPSPSFGLPSKNSPKLTLPPGLMD